MWHYDSNLTWLKQPQLVWHLQGKGQAQKKSNSAKAHAVEAESQGKKKPAQWK